MSPLSKFFIVAVIVADLFAIVVFGGRMLLDGTALGHTAETPVLVEGADEPAAATANAPEEPAFDLAAYVADPVKGAKVAAKCKACHTFEQGGPNRTGPNQWAVYGAPLGHVSGFSYSSPLLDKKSSGAIWNEANLHAFLENPRAWMPGTKMQFNGIRNPQERADLIAWLKTLK